ncbi:MAG: D-glucuronyl C5-epimerase family protein [Planctomycetota bacterium]|nr:D-glucuronyl C5-epimerase family protein [Planctomycetota bacterium]
MSATASVPAISSSTGLRSIIGHVLTTLMSKVWVFALGLALASLRGRVLGPELFAAVVLTLALPNFLLSLFNMGVSASNVYFIGRGEISPAQALRSSLHMAFMLGLLGCLLGGTAILWGSESFFPGVGRELLCVALIIYPVLLVRSFVMSLLHAAENFRWFNGILSCEALCGLAITAVAFAAGGGATSAIVAFGIAAAIGLCLCIVPIRRQLQSEISAPVSNVESAPSTNENYAWRCLNYGWKVNLSNLLAFLNHRGDLFLINAFVTPAAAGIYAGATMVTERMWILSQSVSTVILPRLSRLNADDPSRQRLTRLVSNIVFLLTLPMSLILVFAGRFLLGLLLGPKFIPAADVLVWLLPGTVLASLARVLANDLAARGYVGWNVWNAGVLVVVNVSLNLWLIPKFGIVGAAWSSSLGWTVYTILAIVVYCRLNSTRWWELMIPRSKDVVSLLQLSRATCQRLFDRIGRRTIAKPGLSKWHYTGYVSICLVGGLFLTSLLESEQTRAIVALRNLFQNDEQTSLTDRGNRMSGMQAVHIVRGSALAVLDAVERQQPISISAAARNRLLHIADVLNESHDKRSVNGLNQPWYSAKVQGDVIVVELAAYHLTSLPRYLDAAREAARALDVSIENGGVAIPQSKGHGLWFEEYASPDIAPLSVLNSHNAAMNGLWHLSRIEPEFLPLWDAGVRALKHRLPEFDAGVWSRFDLHGRLTNQDYQKLHVAQLRELFERTGEPRFAEYAGIFSRQLYSPFQIPYRLWMHPEPMLAGLCLMNMVIVAVMSQAIHGTVTYAVNRRVRVRRESVQPPKLISSPAVSISRAA